MAKASAMIAAAPIINTQATKAIAPVENNTAPSVTDEPTPAYRVLTGKYGTLHDYGDHIVHWDIDNFIDSTKILSSYTLQHECYAIGDGFGLPNTQNIAPGKQLIDFGSDIPDGTIFATFIDNGKGQLVYPSSANKVTNYRGHLFVYDAKSGGLSPLKDEVTVYHQYKGPNRVLIDTIKNNETKPSVLANHLDKYYAVTIKTVK